MPEKIWDFNIASHSADNKHYACRETEAKGGRFSRNHCYAKWKRNDRPVTDDVNAGLEPQALRPGLEEFESNENMR